MQYNYYKIFSDSQSAWSAVEHKDIKVYQVNKIIKILIEKKNRGRQIDFAWVPSHSGVVGNKLADVEARIAWLRNDWLLAPRHKKEVKDTLERYVEKEKEWKSTRRSQTAAQFFQSRKDCKKISARKEVCWEIIQLVTAHCNVNTYLHMIGKKDSTLCACGACEENIWHFVFECEKYA